MNHYSMGLTVITAVVVGVGAMYPGLLARRICDFLRVARNRGRLDDLAKEIASENVDEMLVVVPGATTWNFWNTAGSAVEQLPQKMVSPFGDW
jgi:hypothetical protein